MKFLLLLMLSLMLHAEDSPKLTIEELQQKIVKLEADLALQTRISQAFHDQADACNIQFTILKAQQPKPEAPKQ